MITDTLSGTPQPEPDQAALVDLAAHLREFAVGYRSAEPFCSALAAAIAERPAVLALLLAAAPTQRRVTLILAALHDRLLALAEQGAEPPPLAAYYASLGGTRAPDGALGNTLDDFAQTHAAALRETMATQATQTNEIGRSAVLWPALAEIARRHGGQPLALFDFGCSAGLNLLVDAVGIHYTHAGGAEALQVGIRDELAPQLSCRLIAAVPSSTPWRISHRLGTDLAPVSLDDARSLRWLRACLWPSETERARRFERAVALARAARHPVQAGSDGLAVLKTWLRALPAGVTPVLFNSWVLAYFTPSGLATHVERAQGLMREHGLVWLSAEDDVRLGVTTGIAPEAGRSAGEPGTPTFWSLSECRGGGIDSTLLARSHPHGAWLEWLAG